MLKWARKNKGLMIRNHNFWGGSATIRASTWAMFGRCNEDRRHDISNGASVFALLKLLGIWHVMHQAFGSSICRYLSTFQSTSKIYPSLDVNLGAINKLFPGNASVLAEHQPLLRSWLRRSSGVWWGLLGLKCFHSVSNWHYFGILQLGVACKAGRINNVRTVSALASDDWG